MKLQLHWKIFIGMFCGVVVGALSWQFHFQDFVTGKVVIFGTVFLRALKMIIVPLIVSSIITSVTGLGSGKRFGRLSLKTCVYYLCTSLFAIVTGLVLVNLIKPGTVGNLGLREVPGDLVSSADKLGETLIGIIPENPLAAMVQGDIVPTIFFSLLFGFFITRAPGPYRSLLTDFFQGVFDVMMLLTQFIIKFSPIGVFALVADITARSGLSIFASLGMYMLTVFLGLLIHAAVILPLLLKLFGRARPLRHFQAMSSAIMTAFSTASSSATLPLTIESARKNAGVSDNVSGFVLPLGATVNMDGTALYECVAAMFIAQAYGIELSFVQQFVVVLTALLASIGAAGIPMAGLVMIVVILRAVGLPLEGLGMILAVDRVLDMMRTSVNVWSDSCGAVIVARSEGETGLKV